METKFKVGDRVCLKKNIVVGQWYGGIEMFTSLYEKLKDKEMTVQSDKIENHKEILHFDENPYVLNQEMVEKIKDRVIFNGDKTTLISNGKEYTAVCKQGDTFDKMTGVILAKLKQQGITYSEIERLVKDSETIKYIIIKHSNRRCKVQNYKLNRIILSDKELETLHSLKDLGYKYIARDKDNTLGAYEIKIKKHNSLYVWLQEYTPALDWKSFNNTLFQFIKWSDNKPTSIEELLKKSK